MLSEFLSVWNGVVIEGNPPGSHYGLVLQEVELTVNHAGLKERTKGGLK